MQVRQRYLVPVLTAAAVGLIVAPPASGAPRYDPYECVDQPWLCGWAQDGLAGPAGPIPLGGKKPQPAGPGGPLRY